SLYQLLHYTPGFEVVSFFKNCENVADKVEECLPRVILMDINIPPTSGIEAVKEIKRKFKTVDIIMFTVFEEEDKIFEALKAGATGYLLKKTPPLKIIESIQEVVAGGSPMSASIARKVMNFFTQQSVLQNNKNILTRREQDVLKGLIDGQSYKMIAINLSISIETIRTYIKRIYDKMHVNSMTEAVAKALKEKWFE
ncbi:MAG TPA: response regulator transcription factor, partial [Chitinophagaceae bacterium]|nr:response regulator transcription factor [Chitinophagaceae bacterium]